MSPHCPEEQWVVTCIVQRLHVPPGSVDYPLVWGGGDISRMSIPGPATCRYADLRPTVPSHSPHPNQQKALWKKVLNYSFIPEDSERDMKSRWSVSLSSIWGIYHRIWGNRYLFLWVKKTFSKYPSILCLVFYVVPHSMKNKTRAFFSSEKVIIYWITNGKLRLCLSLFFCLCLSKKCW